MNTYVNNGKRITYTNTGSAITSGQPVPLNAGASGKLGVAVADIAATTGTGELEICGVHTLTMLTADTGAIGVPVYWDNANSRLTTTASTHTPAGFLVVAKTGGQTTGTILLNGIPG